MSLRSADRETATRQRDASGVSRRQVYVLLAMLVIQLLLVSPSLMPSFPQINAYDEAQYVGSGRLLLHFEVRDLAWGPLVAVLYAPLHVLLGWSNNWFVLETWAGRFVLFTGLWLSLLYLGVTMKEHLNPFLLAGVLFVNVPFLRVVENQSDALIASLSVLILALLLQIRHQPRLKLIVLASLLVGMCVLTRAEAIVYLVLFPILVILPTWGRVSKLHALLTSTLPALALIALYLGMFGWSTGGFDLGFGGKSYTAFEHHQPIAANSSAANPSEETARLYGTPKENGNSVVRAVLHNPVAFIRRVWIQSLTLPGFFLEFFEKKLGPAVVLLGMWGVVELIHKRQFGKLAVIGVWSLEPAGSIPFVSWHFVSQLSPIFLLFCALGVSRILARIRDRRSNVLHLVSFVALAVFGLVSGKMGLTVAGAVVSAGLLLAPAAAGSGAALPNRMIVGGMVLLVAGIILRNPYPFPNYSSLGSSSEEHAIQFLETSLPRDTLLMAPFPGPALAARMSSILPTDVPDSARTDTAFLPWLQSKNVAAIYLDRQFKRSDEVYRLVDGLAGHGLQVAYETPDRRIRILLPQN